MKSINFRKIFFLGLLVGLGSVTSARAQVAAYGMVTGERLKDIVCVDPRGCDSNGISKPYGGVLGGYFDFRSYGPVRLGVDVRADFFNADKSAYAFQASSGFMRQYSFLGGARATFKTPYKVLRPYVQMSAGLARTDITQPPLPLTSDLNYKNFTQVQGFAGLDLALFQNVDLRLIEVGAGELFGSGSHSVQSIGIGIVFHTSRDK